MLQRKFIGICKKNKLEHSVKWYEHAPKGAVENEEIKVLWDINIECDNLREERRPDLIVIDKKGQKGIIINIAVPADVRVEEKEKLEKYQDLKKEIRKLWKLRNVEIAPVVIGSLGSVSAECDRWMEKLGITCNAEVMLKSALLGTARILRKVLEMQRQQYSVTLWSLVMTCLTEEMMVITARTF